MSETMMRDHMINAIKSRALFYYAFYKEFSAELGPEKTAEIMKRAIYKRGVEIGKQFRQYGPNDMEGLKAAFLAHMPDPQATFSPELERCDGGGLDILLSTCPLKHAWQDAGLSDEEIEIMTDIAGIVDKGTFEGAGFAFEPDTWKRGRRGCCHLQIRPGEKGK